MAKQPKEPNNHFKEPDRPLECGECKKPIAVKYTEIIGNSITHTIMCSECPELYHRLHGIHSHAPGITPEEGAAGLACGNCGTTLQSVRVGLPLGCSHCYEVFDEALIGELLSSEKIPQRLAGQKKSIPFHMGRAQGETQKINASTRLLALNEALSETLKREDYEQAALLRDQIKALTENPEAKETNESQP